MTAYRTRPVDAIGIDAVGIDAVGIDVPARDEQRRIGRCLRALRAAAAELPESTVVAVCVVADRCQDATVSAARRPGGPDRAWRWSRTTRS